METQLPLFEHDGGLAMSDRASGTQWDMPFGWAPTNWLAIDGLAQYGDTTDAQRIARSFTQTIEQNYTSDGTLREKYNVVSGSANIAVAAGYKQNVIGFGWTNGVLYAAPRHACRGARKALEAGLVCRAQYRRPPG